MDDENTATSPEPEGDTTADTADTAEAGDTADTTEAGEDVAADTGADGADADADAVEAPATSTSAPSATAEAGEVAGDDAAGDAAKEGGADTSEADTANADEATGSCVVFASVLAAVVHDLKQTQPMLMKQLVCALSLRLCWLRLCTTCRPSVARKCNAVVNKTSPSSKKLLLCES